MYDHNFFVVSISKLYNSAFLYQGQIFFDNFVALPVEYAPRRSPGPQQIHTLVPGSNPTYH